MTFGQILEWSPKSNIEEDNPLLFEIFSSTSLLSLSVSKYLKAFWFGYSLILVSNFLKTSGIGSTQITDKKYSLYLSLSWPSFAPTCITPDIFFKK